MAVTFSPLQKTVMFKTYKWVLYILFCLFSVILALGLGQYINCLISFSFACLYQKLFSFSFAEHVGNFWYFAIIPIFACKLKKEMYPRMQLIACYLGMWRRGRVKGMGQKQIQEQKWNHVKSLIYFGVIFQYNKPLLVVESSWTWEFCSLTLQESKWILWPPLPCTCLSGNVQVFCN